MKKITIENLLNRKIFKSIDKTKITIDNLKEITKILEVYDSTTIKNRLVNIYNFIKYNVDGDWLNRIDIIRTTLKNDVASEYALEIRYGKDNVEIIKKELYPKFTHTLENYIKKYGKEGGVIKWDEYKVKSKTPWGLEACVEKYGEKEGEIKWNERLSKKTKTQKERKLVKPYRNGRTLLEYQNRYGIDDGYKLWLERNNKQKYRFSKKYYIDLYGEIEGLYRWNEYKCSMSKTSLESYISRYGKDVGTNKYNLYIKCLKYILSEQYYIDLYGDSVGITKYKENTLKKCYSLSNRYSKISQELFWSIYKLLKDDLDNVYFGELNHEYTFFPWVGDLKIMEVDFKYKNKIIEFDGDYWHSKPEQIKKDNIRDSYLISKGYEILRIKEIMYKKDKNIVINECLKFLNE